MTLPLSLASGSPPGVDDFARLVRSLLPNGYAQNDDAIFNAEITAWAVLLHALDQQRRRLVANVFRATTNEMVEEWEHEYQLINDAARELSEREARLVAAETAHGGASPERIATTLAAIDASAAALTPTGEQITNQSLETHSPQLIYQLATHLDEAAWADKATRRSLERVLERVVPARCFGQDGAPSIAGSLATSDAVWNGTDSILGRTRITFDDFGRGISTGLPVARVREWGPGSMMSAADVHALQDALLRTPARGTGGSPTTLTLDTLTAGDERWAFAIHCEALTVAKISDDGDWRNRFAWLAVRSKLNSDIRPGHAADNALGAATQFVRVIFTGAGDTATTSGGLFATLATNIEIFVDSTDHKLYVRNTHATQTAYVVGFVSRTAPYDDATSTGARLVTCQDGQMLAAAHVDATLMGELAARAAWQSFSGSDTDDWSSREASGGRGVVAYLVNIQDGTYNAIDNSIDWRDRIVCGSMLAIDPTLWTSPLTNAGPIGTDRHTGDGATYKPADQFTAPWGAATPGAPVSFVGYTGAGITLGDLTNASKCIALGTDVRLWADDVTGALHLSRDPGISLPRQTYLILVEASFGTSKRATWGGQPALTASNGVKIEPLILDWLQDASLLGVASESSPLGQHHVRPGVRPYLPELLRHHGFVTPQGRGAVGWARRVFATSCNGTTEQILDDTIDWRDRFVRCSVVRSHTYDVLPGHAGVAHANDDGSPVFPITVARYTGPGGHANTADDLDQGYQVVLLGDTSTPDTGICIYARASDGALVLRNQTGLDTHVFGLIDASFQLGLRS